MLQCCFCACTGEYRQSGTEYPRQFSLLFSENLNDKSQATKGMSTNNAHAETVNLKRLLGKCRQLVADMEHQESSAATKSESQQSLQNPRFRLEAVRFTRRFTPLLTA
jgi:hypothetical protein